MNKRIMMAIMAVAVSLMFGSALMAQEKASPAAGVPAQKMELFNGVIEKVDRSKKDVVVEFDKDRKSFSLNDSTKLFNADTKPMKLSNLEKGEWASVEYSKEGNQRVAQTIHLSHFRESGHLFPSEKAPRTSLNW